MTDYFSLLQQPRRPWLDTAALKQQYLALSTAVDPDKVHTGGESDRNTAARKFAELNIAYHYLADPKSRLLHLLDFRPDQSPATSNQFQKDWPIYLPK